MLRRAAARRRTAGVGQRRPGRRPRRAAKAPFTEWPPMATLGRSGDVAARRAVRARAGGRAEGGRHHARLRAGARHPHQPEEPGDRRSRAGREGRRRRAARRRDRPRRCRREGVAACGKHFPGARRHEHRFAPRLPLVEHPPDRLRRRIVPFRAAIEAQVATIMTARLVPALDEKRPATLSRRVVKDCFARSWVRGRHPERRPR